MTEVIGRIFTGRGLILATDVCLRTGLLDDAKVGAETFTVGEKDTMTEVEGGLERAGIRRVILAGFDSKGRTTEGVWTGIFGRTTQELGRKLGLTRVCGIATTCGTKLVTLAVARGVV